MWPHSSSFFVKPDFLFFPFRRTHRRNSVRLSSDYQPREQVPKTSILENLSRGDSCHQGSTQTTTTEGQTPPPGAETRISHIQRFLCWTTSTMPVWTQNTTTSAVMAVHIPQRDGNFDGCDPRVFVCSRDDNTTTTSAIDLGASIPDATEHLPLFIFISFVNDNYSLSLRSNVRPVISFFIVFPEDVLHVIIDLRDTKCSLSLPPRV